MPGAGRYGRPLPGEWHRQGTQPPGIPGAACGFWFSWFPGLSPQACAARGYRLTDAEDLTRNSAETGGLVRVHLPPDRAKMASSLK